MNHLQTKVIQAESNCSELRIAELAFEFVSSLRGGEVVLLEGPLGAGKSTFARAVIGSLDKNAQPEGSPTFPIAHSYEASVGLIVHIDLYRLKNEDEIEERGISALVSGKNYLTLIEWASNFPLWREKVFHAGENNVYEIHFDFSDRGEDLRNFELRSSAGVKR